MESFNTREYDMFSPLAVFDDTSSLTLLLQLTTFRHLQVNMPVSRHLLILTVYAPFTHLRPNTRVYKLTLKTDAIKWKATMEMTAY